MKDTVCYVLDAFPASSETFIANELLELVRRGVEVHIVSMARPDITTVLHPGVASLLPRVTYLDDTSRQRQLRTLGATVLHNPVGLLHACRTTQKLGGHYTWILRHTFPLIEALRRCRCQRVHVHFGGPALEYVALACSVLRKPFTVTLHGSDIFLRPLKALRKLCTLAQRVITVSSFNRNYLRDQFGIPIGKVDVVTCGIDTEFFSPGPETPRRIPGRIVTVARLSPEKGHIYLLEAAERLRDAGVQFEWRMIGDGPLRAQLESMAQKRGLSGRVHFLGMQDARSVLTELRQSCIFALGSTSEAAPVSYFEAMATETPVVGTRVRGVPEFVLEGETGFLVDAEDPAALADRVALLLTNSDLARSLGRKGRVHVVEHLSLARQVDGLMRAWTGSPNP